MDPIQLKVCIDCKIEKEIIEFYFRKDTQKYNNQCKKCICLKKDKIKNKEKSKTYRDKRKLENELNNENKVFENNIFNFCIKCEQEKELKYFTKRKSNKNGYINICKECSCKISKEYRSNNKEKIKRKEKIRNKKLERKLRILLSSRILYAVKHSKNKKLLKTMDLIGCSIEFLKSYLEERFYDRMNGEKMSWYNHGFYGWHIDHIRPCSSFDLSDPREQKKCFHYTNLQPLWMEDNLSKSDNYMSEYS